MRDSELGCGWRRLGSCLHFLRLGKGLGSKAAGAAINKRVERAIEGAKTALAMLDFELAHESPSSLHRLRLSLFLASEASLIQSSSGSWPVVSNATLSRMFLTAAVGIKDQPYRFRRIAGHHSCSIYLYPVAAKLWRRGCSIARDAKLNKNPVGPLYDGAQHADSRALMFIDRRNHCRQEPWRMTLISWRLCQLVFTRTLVQPVNLPFKALVVLKLHFALTAICTSVGISLCPP
ncbi:hypothetical protein BC829DRAFT_156211 [Chytridium lagenaria]|nr:hypothetical protein BC829DRAFT_156211 [Chytridium lagenaria]